MATQADVRRIAMSFPDVVESTDRFAFSVLNAGKPKAFCWVWLERLDPKKGRVPQPKVLGVRVANLAHKAAALAAEPVKFFTEPHYNGYPAILVKLAEVSVKELKPLLFDAWKCAAPRAVVRQLQEGEAGPTTADRSRQTSGTRRRR